MLKAWPSVRHNKTNEGYSKKKPHMFIYFMCQIIYLHFIQIHKSRMNPVQTFWIIIIQNQTASCPVCDSEDNNTQ